MNPTEARNTSAVDARPRGDGAPSHPQWRAALEAVKPSLSILALATLLAGPAIAAPPVRVVVAEPAHPHFSQLSCPNGPGIVGDCRVLLKVHCPETGACIENGSGLDTRHDHATTVTKLAVYQSDPDVQAIVVSGNPGKATQWAIDNQERFNIRVVTRTDGAPASDGSCSAAPLYEAAWNAGIAVVFAAGNQGHNGIANPQKAVIPGACGYRVVGVGFTGTGYVTSGMNGPDCSDDPPFPPPVVKNAGNLETIPIDCSANAKPGVDPVNGPYTDYFTDGGAVSPSVGSGSSFAAPRVASVIANYLTQYPHRSVAQAIAGYLDPRRTPMTVHSSIAGVHDTYHRLDTSSLNTQLRGTRHVPTSGYYYNPDRSGWGLHLSHLRRGGIDEIHLIWYTYTQTGKPIWFTAFGTVDANGRVSAAIREEHKDPDEPASYTTFGNVTLDFINPTSAVFSWNYHGRYTEDRGSERVELLLGDGSGFGGQWFDPADAGWGFSLEMLDGTRGVEYLVLFYFDNQGFPVWAAGQTSNGSPNSSLTMTKYRGFCQGCPVSTLVPAALGALTHRLDTDPWGGALATGRVWIDLGSPYPWPRAGEPPLVGRPILNLLP